jgi:hypothetical protein
MVTLGHEKLVLSDLLALVGELEHARRHAIRSAHVTEELEEKIFYEVTANKARDIRRKVMDSLGLKDEDWCLVKSASALRQLAYEVGLSGEAGHELEQMVDQIYSEAFGTDMSGCKSCINDRPQADISDEDIDAVDAALGH